MNRNRLIRTSVAFIFISFTILTIISLRTINHIVNTENRSIATLLASNIYESINTDLQEQVAIGRTLANDSGIVHLLSHEDEYTQAECEEILKETLQPYVKSLDCNTAFVVSEHTRNYYTQKGFNKTVDVVGDAHDIWYSDFLSEGKDYSFNIDNDETHENVWTVFINVKVFDRDGKFLGVCGIGTEMREMQTFITSMEENYEIKVDITDKRGYIQVDIDDSKIDQKLLDDMMVVDEADDEVKYAETDEGYLLTKYMPEFGWFLIIQKDVDFFTINIRLIAENLLVMILVFIALMAFASYFINKGSAKMAEDVQLNSYGTLIGIYEAVYLIDIKRNSGREIRSLFASDFSLMRENGLASEQMKKALAMWVKEEYSDVMMEFIDFETLPARLEGKRSISMEFRARRLAKGEGWCRARFIVVGDDGQLNNQVLFALEDIDVEKGESEALIRETESAKAASEAKGRFLANMSHEIRTPINAVLGMDTMILRESEEPTIREYAMNIRNAGNTLLSLVNDILDISKIESGKMEIVPVEYDFATLIGDVMNMITVKAESKGLTVNLDVDQSIPSTLYGDDVRIRQIILNLMNNAVKYTEKGSVSLIVKKLSTNGNKVELDIAVEDTGIGIKEEDMAKLFADFERIESSKTHQVEGTGLGMSITVQLLELMGSKVNVESTYGKGSTFSFRIVQKIKNAEPIGDLAKHIEQQLQDYVYSASFTAPDASVLVVDDNDMNRMVFEGLLKPTQVKVTQANSGKAALECVKKEKFDVIFLDHMMPDMDGIEVMKRLKKDENHFNVDTPVIALTANAISGAKEMYIEAGFDAYLSKPIIPEKLERALRKYIPSEKKIIQPNIDGGKAEKSKEVAKASDGLPVIEGLDWNYCMLHLSNEAVLNTVKAFYFSIDGLIDEIKDYYSRIDEEGVLDSYRISVHAIKSTATIIGLLPVAGVAATLEYSARDNNIARVKQVTPHFIELLREYKQKLSVVDDTLKSDKEKIDDKAAIVGLFKALIERINEFDVHAADAILEELHVYDYGEGSEEVIDKLTAAVNNLDNETVENLCNEMLQLLG